MVGYIYAGNAENLHVVSTENATIVGVEVQRIALRLCYACAGTTTEAAASFPLQYGSRGAEVKKLQTALNVLLADTAKCGDELPQYNNQEITALQVDGIFGARTRKVCQWHFGKKTVTEAEYKALLEATA